MESQSDGNELLKAAELSSAGIADDGLVERADQYLASISQTRRAPGRPRKNPIATQRELQKFRAAERRREREREIAEKERVKEDIEKYAQAMVEANPDLMDAILDFAIQLYDNGAAVQDSPLTPYQLRVYISQLMGRLLKEAATPAKLAERMDRRRGRSLPDGFDESFDDWDDDDGDEDNNQSPSPVSTDGHAEVEKSSLPSDYLTYSPGMTGIGTTSPTPPTLPTFEEYLDGKMDDPS